MPKPLLDQIQESARIIGLMAEQERVITRVALKLFDTLVDGGTIYLCGNGGSAAHAQHMAGELMGRFQVDRTGYAAVALTADSTLLTALGNDYGYDSVFVRQVRALMTDKDTLVCLSTSGRSPNVLKAAAYARRVLGSTVIALTGENDSDLSDVANWTIRAPSRNTARIQEAHQLCVHLLCDIIEQEMTSADGMD